jgi:hypothetical protein
MIEVSPDQLKQAVESQHGGKATFVKSVPIHEEHKGRTVWNGAVQVYDLADSPSGATRAYAWSHGLSDGKRRFFAVLAAGYVTSPAKAVQAAIVAEARQTFHEGRVTQTDEENRRLDEVTNQLGNILRKGLSKVPGVDFGLLYRHPKDSALDGDPALKVPPEPIEADFLPVAPGFFARLLLDDVAARKIEFEGRTYGGLVIADRLPRLIRSYLKWYATTKNAYGL